MTDSGKRHELRAGTLRSVLEDGALRWITLALPDGGEREVVRGVYAAVRDHNWGTPAPRFTRYEVQAGVDSFSVRFSAEYVAGEIDLVWEGAIEGSSDGSIAFSMDATARSTFRRNRLGFCVLHPMEAAGAQLEVEHTNGTSEQGVFPVEISPHQPFFDIGAMRQTIGGVTVEVRFEGEIFEMEDQRSWTDASYKTYCTPLAAPYPVEVPAGTTVHQAVQVRTIGDAALPKPLAVLPASPAQRGIASPEPPAIGLQVGGALSERDVELLRRLGLAHLWVTLHLTRADWEQRLIQAAHDAKRLGCALEIEAVCGESGAGIEPLAARLAADKVPVSAIHVYPKSGVVSTEQPLQAARHAFKAVQLSVAIGGGSRADFVNVNRASLPLHLMDFLAFAVNPQVHTFDDASIMETLAAQAVVLENAKRIAQGRPVRVGPITLRQRLNPAATGAEPSPAPDPRQSTQFCAEWTRGSLQALAGAAALTYYETTGPFGVMDNAQPFPVYEVLAAGAPG